MQGLGIWEGPSGSVKLPCICVGLVTCPYDEDSECKVVFLPEVSLPRVE